jgi:hypothetical protein
MGKQQPTPSAIFARNQRKTVARCPIIRWSSFHHHRVSLCKRGKHDFRQLIWLCIFVRMNWHLG